MRIRVVFSIFVSSLLHQPWLLMACSCLREQYTMPNVTEASLKKNGVYDAEENDDVGRIQNKRIVENYGRYGGQLF